MQGAVAPRDVLLDHLGQSRHLGDHRQVGQRAEVGRVARAVVGKVVAGARAAPRRWMMEYLHSCLIRKCKIFTTVLRGASTVELVGGGPLFISMLVVVVKGGLSRNEKKCLNSSRILIC